MRFTKFKLDMLGTLSKSCLLGLNYDHSELRLIQVRPSLVLDAEMDPDGAQDRKLQSSIGMEGDKLIPGLISGLLIALQARQLNSSLLPDRKLDAPAEIQDPHRRQPQSVATLC